MNKLTRLQNEALESCNFRGHTMKRFKRINQTNSVSVCADCGKQVHVNTKPRPNEIEIGGEAVALSCED